MWWRTGGDCREQRVERPRREMRRAAAGHLTCQLEMDSGHNYSRAIFIGWIRVSEPKLSRRREDLESGCRNRGTPGGRALRDTTLPRNMLVVEAEAAWSRVRSGGIVPQLGSPVSKLVHYYSQMQPPATSRQPPAVSRGSKYSRFRCGRGCPAAATARNTRSPHTLTAAACSLQWPVAW